MNSNHQLLLHLPVQNLKTNREFYEKIGFESQQINNGLVVNDGKISILLTEKDQLPAGIIYSSENLQETYRKLQSKNFFPQKISLKNQQQAISITDPTGFSLIYVTPEFTETLPETTKNLITPCGKLYEISLKTGQFAETVAFWQQAGFSLQMGKPEEEKFVMLSDAMYTIGIYNPAVCPHVFNNHALTYFELDMAARIQELKSKGITFRQELPNPEGIVEEAILESPEGQHLFLFKGWE